MGSLTNMFKPALLLSLLLAAAAKPGRGPAPRREANPLPASSRLFSRVFSGLSREAAQPAKERQEDYPWYGSYTYDDNFYYNYNGDYTSLEEHLFEELDKCEAQLYGGHSSGSGYDYGSGSGYGSGGLEETCGVQRDYCHAKLSHSAQGLLTEHPNATATDFLSLAISCSGALIGCHIHGVTTWYRVCTSCHVAEEGVSYPTWASSGPETCTTALDSCQAGLAGLPDEVKVHCMVGVAVCTGYGFSTLASYQDVYNEGIAALQKLYPQVAGRALPLHPSNLL